ncbi:MAG: hypothetical protein HC904_04450, partial [Blastochloris sp.]|nr:hypothetical protein [Blastochloris sp.]
QNAFIEIQAEDDVIVVGLATAGNVTTTNGAITMIAGNANSSDSDGVNGLNTLINADGIYIGSPTANSTTLVQSGGAAGAMTLTATANLGRVRVSGGDTGGANVQVISSADMTISATGAATGPGTLSATDSSAALLVQGGSAGSTTASVTSNSTTATAQVSTLGAGGLRIQGGTGGGSFALMTTTGRQTSTVTGVAATDSILIQGGTTSSDNATRFRRRERGPSIITLTNGNMRVEGGVGGGSSALVSSSGLNAGANLEGQRIVISAGNLVVDAGNNAAGSSSATIELTNPGAATQFIDVEGTISVLGGDGGGEAATIRSAGFNLVNGLAQDINSLNAFLIQSGNTNGGNASVDSTGVFGRQQIVVQTGNLSILQGAGAGNQSFIRAAGDNGVTLPGQEAQRIIVSSGNLIVSAVGTSGQTSFIDLINATTATQFIDVEGTVTVQGGLSGASARIRSAGFNTVNGLAQDINSLNAMLIQSGSVGGSGASLQSTGAFGRQQVVVQTGNLSILAGLTGLVILPSSVALEIMGPPCLDRKPKELLFPMVISFWMRMVWAPISPLSN